MNLHGGITGSIFGVFAILALLAALPVALMAPPASADARWGRFGMDLTNSTETKMPVEICPDGQGGAICVWPQYDPAVPGDKKLLYAQRVDENGTLLWGDEGKQVCTENSDQTSPIITSDGTGGAIVAWRDDRATPGFPSDLYGQRLDATGAVLWNMDGSPIGISGQGHNLASITTSAPGQAFVAWHETNGTDFDVFVQMLTENGAPVLGANGKDISGAAGDQTRPNVVDDGQGGGIVAWQSGGGSDFEVWAQRVDGAGNTLWGAGTRVSDDSQAATRPELCKDSSGGGIAIWQYFDGTDYQALAQLLNSNGVPQWTPGGTSVVDAGSGNSLEIASTSDGKGGVIAIVESKDGSSYDLRGQRLDSAGQKLWASPEQPIAPASALPTKQQVCSDGNGAAMTAWQQSDGTRDTIKAQGIGADGKTVWKGGTSVTDSNNALFPKIIEDARGGALVSYVDYRSAVDKAIAQRISLPPPRITLKRALYMFPGRFEDCFIEGKDFLPGAKVDLLKDGQVVMHAQDEAWFGPEKLYCAFDLPAWMPTGYYDLLVTNPDGQQVIMPNGAWVSDEVLAPEVSVIYPEAAEYMEQVGIFGRGFGPERGNGGGAESTSYVSFNGVRATEYVKWSNTEIIVVVPKGATSGPISVVVGDVPSKGSHQFTIGSPDWYLAEGTTAWGFSTYITIENAAARELTARLTYMDPNPGAGAGVVAQRTVVLPPRSQTTVDPRWDLGDTDFSTKVECLERESITVDRTMSWTGSGAACGEAHNSIGARVPAYAWYLPEGSSAWGFETWTLVQNPTDREAGITLTYMVEGGAPIAVNRTVPARSRATYSMLDDIGEADASILVASDVPVAAERAMYRNDRREGHCSVGATKPATEYFLAEGSTAWGFTTYVLVENPNAVAVDVAITYLTGSGEVPQAPFSMPAGSRKTVRVNDALPDTDFSIKVSGTHPLVAERAMYWCGGADGAEACHDSVGLPSAHPVFYFPDGQTSAGWETWTLVENPNGRDTSIELTYLPENGGASVSVKDTVPACSRRTYRMADAVPEGRASIVVESDDGSPVFAERSMYRNNRGEGTVTTGGYLK